MFVDELFKEFRLLFRSFGIPDMGVVSDLRRTKGLSSRRRETT